MDNATLTALEDCGFIAAITGKEITLPVPRPTTPEHRDMNRAYLRGYASMQAIQRKERKL